MKLSIRGTEYPFAHFCMELPNYEVVYEFGPYRLEIRERRLLEHDRPVRLTRKSFDLLGIFVANAGRLLEKEELMNELWPDAFVEPSNLVVTVAMLRKALHDTLRTHYIQTIPKSGYRFIGAVRKI